MNKENLIKAGLSDGEAVVYLALLKLGSSLVSKIAQETGLHRTNIYDTLEKLREKGLVSHVIRENRKYFAAAHPSKIMDFLNEKQEAVKEILPELIELTKTPKDQVDVEIFKSKEGVKTVINDIIMAEKDYVAFGALEELENLMPAFSKQLVNKVEKSGVKGKVILREGEKITKSKNEKYRILSKKFMFPTTAIIYGDKVALFIWKTPFFVILIENKETADSYRAHFKLLWGIAKP